MRTEETFSDVLRLRRYHKMSFPVGNWKEKRQGIQEARFPDRRRAKEGPGSEDSPVESETRPLGRAAPGSRERAHLRAAMWRGIAERG